MSKRFFLTRVLVAVSLGVLATVAAAAEKTVSLDKVPAKVRATIKEHAAGTKVQKVEVVTQQVYDVEIKKGGKTIEFSVTPEGKYLGVKNDEAEHEEKVTKDHAKVSKHEKEEEEEECEAEHEGEEAKDHVRAAKHEKEEVEHEKKVTKGHAKVSKHEKEEEEEEETSESEETKHEAEGVKKAVKQETRETEADEKEEAEENASAAAEGMPPEKAPKPVQATVKKLIGKGKLLELALEADGNYELDYQVKGVHQAAIIAPDGKIQEEEVTVEASTLPKAVTKAVKKLYPKGKITLAEKSTTESGAVYELKVADGKKSHSVTISPEGEVQE